MAASTLETNGEPNLPRRAILKLTRLANVHQGLYDKARILSLIIDHLRGRVRDIV